VRFLVHMKRRSTQLLFVAVIGVSACGKDETKPLAEKQDVITQTEEKAPEAVSFTVDSTSAKVRFEMEAPFERQEGEVPSSAVSGRIDVDLTNLSKSKGLVDVDISELVIYQQVAEEEGQYGDRTKSDLQNEHMRDWLEIGDDAPPEEAKKNRLVQFSLEKVEEASATDVGAMTGKERVVTFVGVGDFRLHQRVAKTRVPMRATFLYDGDGPTSMTVETVEPFAVDLAEHDVRPRTGFGKLAEKTLGAMSPKVGKEAHVNVRFSAKPAG
jgi:hypothetical protein